MITHEIAANWFFRLNGFLTIPNFIIHPDNAGPQITDVDVLGVRFPNRQEIIRGPMTDAFPAEEHLNSLFLALVEVKASLCEVNRVLSTPESDGLDRVLRATGVISDNVIEKASKSILDSGLFTENGVIVSHVCIGRESNPNISEKFPEVAQITWEEALGFIFDRFGQYRGPKADHSQWDLFGRYLWVAAARFTDRQRFINFIVHSMTISASV